MENHAIQHGSHIHEIGNMAIAVLDHGDRPMQRKDREKEQGGGSVVGIVVVVIVRFKLQVEPVTCHVKWNMPELHIAQLLDYLSHYTSHATFVINTCYSG